MKATTTNKNCPDCGVSVRQPHQDERDVRRNDRLCNMGCEGIHLNEEHVLVRRLTPDQRAELVAKVKEVETHMRYIEVDWVDPSELEAQRWRSPLEKCVNLSAWGTVESHPEWIDADAEAVLASQGLPSSALACLDEDDQYRLGVTLAKAAVAAFKNGWDVIERLRETLMEWLQDWTETDEEDLQALVVLAKSMSGHKEQKAGNWVTEGF